MSEADELAEAVKEYLSEYDKHNWDFSCPREFLDDFRAALARYDAAKPVRDAERGVIESARKQSQHVNWTTIENLARAVARLERMQAADSNAGKEANGE